MPTNGTLVGQVPTRVPFVRRLPGGGCVTLTKSTVAQVPDGLVAKAVRGPDGRLGLVVVPVGAVLSALVVGGVLMAAEGVAPLSAYGEVVLGVFGRTRGLIDTAVMATPLVLLGLGIAVAYR